MENSTKSQKTSQRPHPYARKETSKSKKAAKQAAKERLKGTIFVDALPTQDDKMVTSEHFKKSKESTHLQEMKSLVNQVGQTSENSEVEVVEEGEISKEGPGDYPYASLD